MLVQKITSKLGTTGIIGAAFLSSLLVLFLLAPHMTLPVHAGTHQHSDRYLSPSEMVFGPGGKALYVLCEQSDEILVLDAQRSRSRITSRSVIYRGRLSSRPVGTGSMSRIRGMTRSRRSI